ncbi:unnamed protein product [Urochloa humidicola]
MSLSKIDIRDTNFFNGLFHILFNFSLQLMFVDSFALTLINSRASLCPVVVEQRLSSLPPRLGSPARPKGREGRSGRRCARALRCLTERQGRCAKGGKERKKGINTIHASRKNTVNESKVLCQD